jgi:hypothetical protein
MNGPCKPRLRRAADGSFPRPSVALDGSDRLNRLLGEARLVDNGVTVVLVSSTVPPGSDPNLRGVQRVVVADEPSDGRAE